MLVDIRFKLLAFVPLITGAIVTVAGRTPSGASAIVAVVAFGVLLGVVVYDLRNTAFHDATVHRASQLERLMAFNRLSDKGSGTVVCLTSVLASVTGW